MFMISSSPDLSPFKKYDLASSMIAVINMSFSFFTLLLRLVFTMQCNLLFNFCDSCSYMLFISISSIHTPRKISNADFTALKDFPAYSV
jgi:hypothetical protein